ncbi:MAG: Hsp20/alpha crystallin family protein [Verrucomicrobia bacterium]|nr:Hsp20/alpha crystallin family protein [Verrucomicrobiota bacterium]MBV8483183.1 Hsp20/alpha crystallin family protein [Verrucomicrobiota bacterium]
MNEQFAPSERRQEMATRQSNQFYFTPLVDVQSTPENIVLRAEMAGVDKTGLEITVEDGNLVLVGRRSPLNVSGDPIYAERSAVDYRRVYELDPSIDTDKITARIEDGILTVTLPKAERVKPRKIALE